MKNLSLFICLVGVLTIASACILTEEGLDNPRSDSGFVETRDDQPNAGTVKLALVSFQEGRLEPGALLITYSDLHPLHGGLELTIDGSGNVQQQALNEEVKEAKNLNLEEVMQLVTLLIELEAWQQTVPEREPVPDESRAILRIEAGDSESQIWEWYNDMSGNDRMIRIREMMKQFAWD